MEALPISYVEIDSDALQHNIQLVRRYLPKNTKLGAVVKSNAYGHGLREVVKTVRDQVDCFFVYELVEALEIRQTYPGSIIVLGPTMASQAIEAIRAGLTLTVDSICKLKSLDEIARSLGKKVSVHCAIDSFFGREGLMPSQIGIFVEELRGTSHIVLTGAFSHFSSAGEDHTNSITPVQQKLFFDALESLHLAGYNSLESHLCATAGIFRRSKNSLLEKTSLTRLGIGLYGYWPSDTLMHSHPLKKLLPALTWKSQVALLKEFPANHPIGYNHTFYTTGPSVFALVPQGYGNGYPRALSNQGIVLIHGIPCPVRGIISMNSIMVEVTHLYPAISEGDEVVLLGTQGESTITAESIAQMARTINYEVVTGISPLLPRRLL